MLLSSLTIFIRSVYILTNNSGNIQKWHLASGGRGSGVPDLVTVGLEE